MAPSQHWWTGFVAWIPSQAAQVPGMMEAPLHARETDCWRILFGLGGGMHFLPFAPDLHLPGRSYFSATAASAAACFAALHLCCVVFKHAVLADAMLGAQSAPKLRADLVPALADLQADDLTRHATKCCKQLGTASVFERAFWLRPLVGEMAQVRCRPAFESDVVQYAPSGRHRTHARGDAVALVEVPKLRPCFGRLPMPWCCKLERLVVCEESGHTFLFAPFLAGRAPPRLAVLTTAAQSADRSRTRIKQADYTEAV
eukprot:331733-Chlamydomonas_euryale.AAC.4